MVDFDKLNNIDDWEALGINYNPTSHKDWTIQDLLIARDKLNDLINAIPDSQKYSIFNKDAANSDHVRLLLLRSAFENALSNHKQNTALWAKDPHLNEYTSKAEDYDGNTYKDHFGEEQTAELKKELGTEGTSVNEPKDTNMSEQERELRNAILGGMKEGPDERW